MNSTAASAFDSIPVIDVSPLFGSDAEGARKVADAIRQASIEIGFFYVSGHNVARDLTASAGDVARSAENIRPPFR